MKLSHSPSIGTTANTLNASNSAVGRTTNWLKNATKHALFGALIIGGALVVGAHLLHPGVGEAVAGTQAATHDAMEGVLAA